MVNFLEYHQKDLARTNGANTQNFEFLFVTDCRFDQTLVVSEVKGIKGSQKGPNTQNDENLHTNLNQT
jgi:hypothetical protein